jgi:hypothetical protein
MKNILPLVTSKIDIAPELEAIQSLMPISGDDYQRLKTSIKKDGQRDQVKGYYGTDGRFKLLSGVNRLKACIELKLDTVLIEPVNIPENERQDFAISENLDRRHFTSEQKREVVKLLLKNNPEMSARQIAKKANVDHKTVIKIQDETGDVGKFPTSKTDSLGRKQPAKKPRSEFPNVNKAASNPSKLPQDERKTSKVNHRPPGNEILTNIDIKTQIISQLDSLDNDDLNKVWDYIQSI